MSMEPAGGYVCDRCGADVGNGGVQFAAIVTDRDPATGNTTPRRLDFCRDRPGPEGKTIQGCRDRVLTKRALRHYHETRTTS